MSSTSARHVRVVAALAAILAGTAACTPPGQHELIERQGRQVALEQNRAHIGHLVVVPSAVPPEAEWQMYYSDAAGAAGSGAGQGALAGLGLAAAGGISIILAPITVPAGALIGSIYGAGSAVTPEQAERIEAPVRATTIALPVQSDFAEAVAEAVRRQTNFPVSLQEAIGQEPAAAPASGVATEGGRRRRAGHAHRADRLHEAAFSIADACPAGLRQHQAPASSGLEPDGTETLSAPVPNCPLPTGRRMGGARLRSEAKRCYQQMADSFVVQQLVAMPALRGRDSRCGLLVEPLPIISGWFGVNVDTLNPTLKWQPFPAGLDTSGAGLSAATDVSAVIYEVGIWEGEPYDPYAKERDPVYYRSSLHETEHRLEENLEPSTTYAYSVRARFLAQGQPRLTPWARDNFCQSEADLHGDSEFTWRPHLRGLYRLRTP